jgi:hypothetical protein
MTASGRTAVVRLGRWDSQACLPLFTLSPGGGVIITMGSGSFWGWGTRGLRDDDRWGPALGLLVAFLGVAMLNTPSRPIRKVASPIMVSIPASLPRPVVQVLRGSGYHLARPNLGDDLIVTFGYYPHEPYSVRLGFSSVDPCDGSLSAPSLWEISREVLSAGAIHGVPNELGDFRVVEPTVTAFRLRLMSTEECYGGTCPYYSVSLSRSEVRSFLLRTFRAVPEGRESAYVDIDGALERLLA